MFGLRLHFVCKRWHLDRGLWIDAENGFSIFKQAGGRVLEVLPLFTVHDGLSLMIFRQIMMGRV